MKALIAAILVVCIVFTGGITYLNLDNRDAVIVEHAQALAAEQSTQEVPAAMEDVPRQYDRNHNNVLSGNLDPCGIGVHPLLQPLPQTLRQHGIIGYFRLYYR